MYSTPDEDVKVSALVKGETIWLTQKAMGELFDVNVPAISKHLKNVFDEGELQESSTVSILEIVQEEGTRRVKRNPDYAEFLHRGCSKMTFYFYHTRNGFVYPVHPHLINCKTFAGYTDGDGVIVGNIVGKLQICNANPITKTP